MQHSAKTLLLTLPLLVLLPVVGTAGAEEALASPQRGANETLSPKGIYYDVDRYQRTGIKFSIKMDENGKERRVPVSYPFQSGDHFTFTFEINRGTYIYVINSTAGRDPTPVSAGYQAKRVARPQTVSHGEPLSDPRLLFPTHRAGVNNRLSADVPREIPHKGYFAMDADSGTEKLYVVISDRRLDFGDYFDSATDRIKQRYGSPDHRIVARLEARLSEWKKNAAVELVPKGIVHEVDSYGVSIDPSKPAMVEIDLKHYR